MKKIMSVVLSVCMVVMMSVPAFAYSSSDVMKVQLSDQAMTAAVGGCSGGLDAKVTSYAGTAVQATFTNGLTLMATNADVLYSLENINPGTGAITQQLIAPSHAPQGVNMLYATSSCNGTVMSGCAARVRVWAVDPSGACSAVQASGVRLP